MKKFNILIIVMLFLLPWSSCNSMPKDSVHVESETTLESIMNGTAVHPVIKYYMTDGKVESGAALRVSVYNDSIYDIWFTSNKFLVLPNSPDTGNMKKKTFYPMDNESQLSMIDQVLGKIEQSYNLATIHRIILFTQYLGDFSVRLADRSYRKHNDLRKIVMNDIFYKKLSLILGRHGLNVSFISLEDVYWNLLENIDPYCIISKNNKSKIYVDGLIYLTFGETDD